MKTMDDFKGSKGDLSYKECDEATKEEEHVAFEIWGNDHLADVKIGFNIDLDGNASKGISLHKAEANAKLFANSKKVLEIAIKLRDELIKKLHDEHFRKGDFDFKSHPLIHEAEQAINDSL